MPHLTIDYSSRLAGVLDAGVLVKELHPLVLEESGSAGVCKTLVRPVDTYVGDIPSGETAFLHIEVGLLVPPRTPAGPPVRACPGPGRRTSACRRRTRRGRLRGGQELAGSYRLSPVATAGG
ncbi:5-carboxymethyl-2-hydroxymuconate delta isomerase [Streptomyces nogalater]